MQKKMMLAGLLVLAGGLLLVKELFHLDFSVFKILLALAFIAGGVCLLTWRRPDGQWMGGVHGQQQAGDALRMSYAFCDDVLDLTSQGAPALIISVCFGRLVVRYDPACPPVVEAQCAFGQTRLPGGQAVHFGSARTEGREDAAMRVHTDCAFGSIEFEPWEVRG